MLHAGNFLEEKICSRNLKLCGHFFIFDPLFSLGQKLKIQKVNFFWIFLVFVDEDCDSEETLEDEPLEQNQKSNGPAEFFQVSQYDAAEGQEA